MLTMAVGNSADVDPVDAMAAVIAQPHWTIELKGKGLTQACFLVGR